MDYYLADARRTRALGADLAGACRSGCVIYLVGELGAGKTTLTRGFLQALGYGGSVKSPTYTLLEPYDVGARRVYHLDLFRLSAPEELEYLGLRDLLEPDAVLLVEWPQRGVGLLPPPDLRLILKYAERGRRARIEAHTPRGRRCLGLLGRAPKDTGRASPH